MLQKVITISGVEQKLASNQKMFFNIKDLENKTYKLWTTKQDGTETVAYQTFKSLPNNGLNQTILINYEEQPGNWQGKPVTYRTIMTINPNIPASTQINATVKQNIEKRTEEEKWDKISWGKVRHGVSCEFIKNGRELNEETKNEINQWTKYIMEG